MPLRTTVIGAFPKPGYLKVPKWFDFQMGSSGDYLSMYNKYLEEKRHEETDETMSKALKEVILLQTDIGIDVITDGELQRENYVHNFCRGVKGFDFDNLITKTYRNGACKSALPVIVSRLSSSEDSWVWKEWKQAQDLSSIPVKITIPGPMTIINTTVNKYYADEKLLAQDLVNIIAKEICALAEAGCKYIQIDEPLMVRQPDIALDYGIDNLTKCFAKLPVPEDITKVVHLCCGYPQYLDEQDYLKADQKAYFKLAEKLDNGGFDELSIEDAHRHNDLSLLSLFTKTKVILGVIGIARSQVETVEEIKERLTEALKYIPAERLIVAPDCGCGFLSTELATQKLVNMVKAAKSVI